MRSDPRSFWDIVAGARQGTEGWQTVDLLDASQPFRCLAQLASVIGLIPEPGIGIEIHVSPALAERLPIIGEWHADFPHRLTIIPDHETPAGHAELRLYKVS